MKGDFNLSSEKEAMLQSFLGLGMLFGAFIGGYISDRVGRRPAFIISIIISTGFGLAASQVQSYEALLLCRAGAGIGLGSNIPVDFTLYTEFLPTKVSQSTLKSKCNPWSRTFCFLCSVLSP